MITETVRPYAGSIAFGASGVGLFVATLIVAPWSAATIVGLLGGLAILVVGCWQGVPKARTLVPRPRAVQSISSPRSSIISAGAAVGGSLGVAYLAREISRAGKLGIDLGVVAALVAAATLLYVAILQFIVRRSGSGQASGF